VDEPDWAKNTMPGVSQAELVPIVQATKIGGIPRIIQGFEPGSREYKKMSDWTFLCTISSIWDQRFSRGRTKGIFVNQPEKLPEYRDFMLADVGQIYLFADESGTLIHWWDFY
jgi:hypothetical protein